MDYDKWTSTYDFDYIEDISKERIKNDSVLILIDENGKRLKEIRENTEYSINYEQFKVQLNDREESGKRYEHIGKDTLGLAINILNADLPGIEADTSKKTRMDAWIVGLKKDIYLFETVNILKNIEEYKAKNARKEE